ncbi:unnamed protein product [Acanthoscelides obtectus]|uniref:PiggyBac transposable element-derived protein domain-containing protein n=1 Tax=Acanthoscelides obtectus TaxID=200917 RepID=A0A9P0KSI6_ACAOB|nr:unnamed protein product [Acanthoscelides obtectus]CAK1641911.1 hypothetical protein AOBTE_LOCUS12718 [Acanthoscelides obtectus]
MNGNPNRVRFTDPNFEETVQRWFEECDEDFSDQDADPESNITSENAITSDHETTSELSYSASDDDGREETQVIESEEDSETSEPVNRYFYGKNRYKWAATEPTRNVRTPAHNILKLPGNKNALPSIEPVDAWRKIFSDDILDIVVHYTNLKIQEFRSKPGNENRTEYRETNSVEINYFLGLLLLSAVFKSNTIK